MIAHLRADNSVKSSKNVFLALQIIGIEPLALKISSPFNEMMMLLCVLAD